MLVVAHRIGLPRSAGFTLVELMVAVAVLAILTTLAVPSFNDFIARQRLRAASFDLRTDLILARSEALKRNRNVTIRPREDAGWQTGWVVVLAVDDTLLRSHGEVGASVAVGSDADEITFNGSGRVASPAGRVQLSLTGAFGSDHNRCLVLDPSGMPSTRREACT